MEKLDVVMAAIHVLIEKHTKANCNTSQNSLRSAINISINNILSSKEELNNVIKVMLSI